MRAAAVYSSQLFSRKAIAAAVLLVIAAVSIRLGFERTRRPAQPVSGDLEQAARQRPDDLETQLNWGAQLYNSGQTARAAAVFEHSNQLAPKDPRAIVWLGMIAVQQHHSPVAVECFKRALAINPSDGDVWLSLAELQQASGALKEAEADFGMVTRLQPNNSTAWRLFGELEARRKLPARALQALENSVRLAPKDMKAQGALGAVDLQLGRLPEAKAALSCVVDAGKAGPAELAELAQAEMRLDPSPASLNRATDLIAQSIAQKQTPAGSLARGQLHLLRKEYAAAAADLNTAIHLDSHLLVAYGYLSQAYAALGEAEKAKAASEEYSRLNRTLSAGSALN